jgi:hypothetical protein
VAVARSTLLSLLTASAASVTRHAAPGHAATNVRNNDRKHLSAGPWPASLTGAKFIGCTGRILNFGGEVSRHDLRTRASKHLKIRQQSLTGAMDWADWTPDAAPDGPGFPWRAMEPANGAAGPHPRSLDRRRLEGSVVEVLTRLLPQGLLAPSVCALSLCALSLCALTLPACTKQETTAQASQLTVVQVDPQAPAPFQLAVQACAGLHNRKVGGSVYIQLDPHDKTWLDELDIKADVTVSAADFLNTCVAVFPACVRYNYKNQQELLPNILTVAAALDAVPLDDGLTVTCGNVAFDATQQLKDKNTPYLATKFVFENYVQQTTGLAMLNPGYDDHPADPAHPALTRDMRPALVDFVFSQKLFVVFLNNGCIDGNPEKEVLSSIVNAGHWPTPLGVYGYNNSWNVAGGDLYEAQTKCLDSRNMGAIASETGNLAFFSTRRAPIAAANVVAQNALEPIQYDPSKTYVAFVVGDGDNVQYMMTTRHDWFRQRLADCQNVGNACPPLTWTISPHLARLAPDLLEWYYGVSHRTGKDYFTLPPSGHLYAYPSSLAEQDQDRFVTATEDDARILGVTGTVHWDWSDSWHDAEDHFLPKYAKADGAIRGVFPVNVPYMFPAFDWWPDARFFEVITGKDGGKVVVFRPREWRGVNNNNDAFLLSPEKMAEELGGYPKGTVTWVYMTSDGGLSLDNSFAALAKILPAHVQLVSADTAAKLALAAGQK